MGYQVSPKCNHMLLIREFGDNHRGKNTRHTEEARQCDHRDCSETATVKECGQLPEAGRGFPPKASVGL